MTRGGDVVLMFPRLLPFVLFVITPIVSSKVIALMLSEARIASYKSSPKSASIFNEQKEIDSVPCRREWDRLKKVSSRKG